MAVSARLLKVTLGILFAVSVSACAEVRVSLNYVPTNTEEIDSQIFINDFTYHPKEGIKEDEIRETAMGRVFLSEPVGRYISDAVRREFRQSGISLKGTAECYLDGEISDFAIDSLGYSADYLSDIRYILHRKENASVVFDSSYQVKFNTSKFVVAAVIMANINKAVSDNVKQLLVDPRFVKEAESKCARPS